MEAIDRAYTVTRTLLPDYVLLDKTKEALASACEKLSLPSARYFQDSFSEPAHKIPLILALRSQLEAWATEYNKEDNDRQALDRQKREHYDRLIVEGRAWAKRQKQLEFENGVFRKMFETPGELGDVVSLGSEQPTHTGKLKNSKVHPRPSTTSTPDLHGAGDTRANDGERGTGVTTGDKLDNESSNLTLTRLRRWEEPGVLRFTAPQGIRGEKKTFIYEFSQGVLVKPNALYPPAGGASDSSVALTVEAFCPGKRNIQVSLSNDQNKQLQRVTPTRLVFPGAEINMPKRKSETNNNKLRLPLPMTLEELFTGVTKEAVLFNTSHDKRRATRDEVILKVKVDAGMHAGQEILQKARPPSGKAGRDISFVIYEIEHPVFSRERSNLQMFLEDAGHILGPESIRITTIDGSKRWLNVDITCFLAKYQLVNRKGMPVFGAAGKGSRGFLRIDFV